MMAATWKRVGMVAVAVTLAACGGEGAAGTPGAASETDGAAAVPAAVPAAAPETAATGGSIADAEVRAYRLTPEGLAAWHRLQMAVARAHAADPSLRREDDEEGTGGDADRMLARIQGDPTLLAAAREAGLSPREAAVQTMALVNASMGMAMEMQGQPLPAEVSREQVEFVKAHRAEIERMTAERRAVEEGAEGAAGGE